MTIDGAMPWMERSADEPICVGAYVRVASVGEVTVVFATAMPIRRLARGDVVGLRAELAALEAVDVVSQADVARSGLVSEATFHRDCVAYREGGDEAVRRRTRLGTKEVTKLVASVVETIRTLHLEGASNVAVGAKVGVSEGSVRGALRRLGLVPVAGADQVELPTIPQDASFPVQAVVVPAEVRNVEGPAVAADGIASAPASAFTELRNSAEPDAVVELPTVVEAAVVVGEVASNDATTQRRRSPRSARWSWCSRDLDRSKNSPLSFLRSPGCPTPASCWRSRCCRRRGFSRRYVGTCRRCRTACTENDRSSRRSS